MPDTVTVTREHTLHLFQIPEVTMFNPTISVEDELIRQARIEAIEQSSLVSAKVRKFLAQYARGTHPATSTTPVVLPVFDGVSGLQPGIDPLSNRSL